ncbi:tRNA 2-selenouridine synthase [Litoreibacter ponti]|uniref:tRNA 2-selenouridine synthase n=1 Tax=Litoreibacter ponti TaxID=1510457 RepID=A0A2T6BDT0_9RHOB|nr:tRNA 2-selenouridine(34) synthase MnmH [Litoreibacter ponti]PTX54194.1 tRNA 2-selenouridine synthase [Litoreibacter ponti]
MFKPTSLPDLLSADVDAVIDVRSPAEFAEDHVPGAINLPVLDNEERARVGTIYTQIASFEARKIGAALVFRNAANHIETTLAGYPGGWRPLVYCWRGGQRSGSFTWMLREIGWRAEVIEGGYRSFRRLVVADLYDKDLAQPMIRLGGYTGTAKTELLAKLRARGVQVLDLEGLARHRGSLLGARTEPQPSQKAFETALAVALSGFDPARPVIVEAESSKIGVLNLPPSLWSAMQRAPLIEVRAPLDARAKYLAEAYADILSDGPALREKLEPLRKYRGHATVDRWDALIAAGDQVALCHALAVDHYDPAYAKSAGHLQAHIAARLETDALTSEALDTLAARIEQTVQTISI